MLCSPDTRRNSSILHDEYPVILDALILHIFRKLDYMHDTVNRTRDHRGQANFSACPVWMHTQSNITNIIFT
jgi:hypothetical protein